MNRTSKLLIITAAAVLLVGVILLARQAQSNLVQKPKQTEPSPTIPIATQGCNPNATLAPGFGEDEFPIVPVG